MATSPDLRDPHRLTGVRAIRCDAGPARNIVLWALVIGFTLALQWRWLVLYLDIRYTFGAFRAAGQLGLPASDIFIHRPMANRLVMWSLDQLTSGSTVTRERLTLGLAVLCSGLAGSALARTLHAWVPGRVATGVGLATFTALAWAPAVTVLQPEWTAVLLCVGAVSLGLARRAHFVSWRSPLIAGAGLLLAVATLQKYTTATTVLVALGVLFVLHRRRAWMVAGHSVLLTGLLLALTLLNGHERQWFVDMPQLNQPGGPDWHSLGRSLWNLAWLNPVLMFWPAAVVLGFRLSRRLIWLSGSVLALAVVLAGVIVQNGYFPYHFATLPVLAASQVALAYGQWWRRTGRLPAVLFVGLAWLPVAVWLAHRPAQWRAEHVEWAVASVGLVVVASTGLAAWQARPPSRPSTRRRGLNLPLAVSMLILALVISFPGWPRTPYALFTARASRVSEVGARAHAMEVGRQIRESAGDARLVYLGRQDAAYFVDLPTSCAYPAATFLYRSARVREPGGVLSLQENLACLRDPATEYLLLQPSMIDPGHALGLVRVTVAAEFDCDHPAARAGSFVLCPRR